MSSPIYEPEPERRKWRKRRRKWYVRWWHGQRDRFLRLGWKGRTAVLAPLVLLAGLLLFYPFGDEEIMIADSDGEGRERIPCLLPGQRQFQELCTVETMMKPGGTTLIVRSPDGEFRRFLVGKDGRGVMAADGAEAVMVKPAGAGRIDVTAGDIVWRLPARVEG